MKLESLRAGMTVYDVGRQKMGTTKISTVSVWEVFIVHVDAAGGFVHARWNGNKPGKYYRWQVSGWRVKKPTLVRSGFGHRLATREELKAMKDLTP